MHIYHGLATYPEFESDVSTADKVTWSPELQTELVGSKFDNLSREAKAIVHRAWQAHNKNVN